MRYMRPAWSVTFLLEGFDSDEMLTSWKWEGSTSSKRFVLSACDPADPATAMGRVTVKSWQPYKSDAVADARRSALDLCAVLGAAIGGPSVRLIAPPLSIDAREGAKSLGGIVLSDSASAALTQHLDGHQPWLVAVDKLHDDAGLRADLDTFSVAKRERDQAARILNLYRIYDRYTRAVLERIAPLLGDSHVREEVSKACVAALPDDLDDSGRSRIQQAVTNALARVRARPRTEVIHSTVIELKGCEHISKSIVERIDSRRGRVAHNPTVLEEAVADQEADTALFTIVWNHLKTRLDI